MLSFQYRILNNLLLSLYNVKNNCNSPLILKKSLNLDQNCVNINDNKIKLRNGKNIVKSAENINRFSQQTFCYFFKKILANFRNLNFHLNFFSFKKELLKDMEIIFFRLSDIFLNFNIKFSSFNYININERKQYYNFIN